jgi:hypothetical protein
MLVYGTSLRSAALSFSLNASFIYLSKDVFLLKIHVTASVETMTARLDSNLSIQLSRQVISQSLPHLTNSHISPVYGSPDLGKSKRSTITPTLCQEIDFWPFHIWSAKEIFSGVLPLGTDGMRRLEPLGRDETPVVKLSLSLPWS